MLQKASERRSGILHVDRSPELVFEKRHPFAARGARDHPFDEALPRLGARPRPVDEGEADDGRALPEDRGNGPLSCELRPAVFRNRKGGVSFRIRRSLPVENQIRRYQEETAAARGNRGCEPRRNVDVRSGRPSRLLLASIGIGQRREMNHRLRGSASERFEDARIFEISLDVAGRIGKRRDGRPSRADGAPEASARDGRRRNRERR